MLFRGSVGYIKVLGLQSMSARRPISPDALSAESVRLIKVLDKGTDFTVVIVGLSYLDACLASLLSRHFRSGSTADELLDSNKGPLGALVTKAKLAYALGLIDKPFLHDILVLAELRNVVAHSHAELNFEESAVRAQCERLSLITTLTRLDKDEPLLNKEQYQRPRDRFILSAVIIWGHILAMAHGTKRVEGQA
jgi:DNA-binding MltR family transcriptional regulator